MTSLARAVLGLVAWAACLFGVLQLRLVAVHGVFAHAVCGPWGCGPPVSALIAWHGFWLLLFTPPIGWFVCSWPAGRLRLLGRVLSLASVLCLAAVGVWQAVTWLPNVADGQPTYFIQRYLFSVVTLVDLPVIPIGLAGLATWTAAHLKERHRMPARVGRCAPGLEAAAVDVPRR